ncbi:MAG TPA: FAD binding domain-containing protein [Acidimicrobiales bacterium]|nr:FAD binding domain-containing protein [Acidimicrobiales bacterium]
MKAAPFAYHRPDTVADAAQALADLGDGAKVLAGGQSLIPMMALRLTAFDHLVDVGGIAELRGVERRADALWVGAATTESAVETDAAVAQCVPLLARATPLIGHLQIRNRGTLGGSIAHADPAAEYPAAARTLDAQMEVASPAGRRTIAASDFFESLWTTTMAPDEVLVGVSFPVWTGRTGFAVEELARRHGDFALAGAMVAIELDTDDRIRRCAIGLFGLGSVPERASAVEHDLLRRPVGDVNAREVGHLAVGGLPAVPDDLHAPARYRAKMGEVMAARAWEAAVGEALRGNDSDRGPGHA